MKTFEIVLCGILASIIVLCSLMSLFALLEQNTDWALYFGGGAGCGLLLWVLACPKDDPVDELLEENMVIGEVHPAAWQLEEVMDIRLEAYLNRMWKRLHKEWGFDLAATASYDDGLRCGFAIATRQIASHFDIELEKP